MTDLLGITFTDALDRYRSAGWVRSFPLAAGTKHPPPGGITGADGRAPTPEEVTAWRRWPAATNLGIAVPKDLIGIDVDQYGAKNGADALATLERRLGVALPPSRRSTSRGPANPSGIRFYRVPPGLWWRGELCPHVEVIAWHYRYAVVWPSIHPDTGQPYQWYDDADDALDTVPQPGDEWPDLPWQFIAHATRAADEPAEYDPPALQRADRPDWHPKVAAKLAEFPGAGSRHESARDVCMALARHEQLGLPGATSALEELRDEFVAAVTEPGPAQRGSHQAAAEWGRLVSGARTKAQTTRSTVLEERQRDEEFLAEIAATATAPGAREYERNEVNEERPLPAGSRPSGRARTNERSPGPRLTSSNAHPDGSDEGPGQGDSSSNSFLSSDDDARPWPKLDAAALHGPLGEAVGLLGPHTEADPAAVLATLLVGVGTIIGSGPHARAGHVSHPARLGAVIVGDTAKARKGTSWSTARLVLDTADSLFMVDRVLGGFGSGEAVVDEVRDPSDDDQGAPDKRLLIHEAEFARVLKVCSRETSVLSAVIRDAWDGSRLQTRARSKKAIATGHHIGIVGHITAPELRRNLTETEIAGGFANRLLWICAKRSQRLPFGGSPDEAALRAVGRRIADRVAAGRKIGTVGFADDARDRWEALYDEMAEDDPGGMLGAIVARPEPQTLRLALTYALLDGQRLIGAEHIAAAWAVWSYSRASAAYIWGDSIGDEIADRLLRDIRRAGPDGLDLSAQSAALGRNVTAVRLAAARTELERRGLIETVSVPPKGGRGRPRSVSRARRPEKSSQ